MARVHRPPAMIGRLSTADVDTEAALFDSVSAPRPWNRPSPLGVLISTLVTSRTGHATIGEQGTIRPGRRSSHPDLARMLGINIDVAVGWHRRHRRQLLPPLSLAIAAALKAVSQSHHRCLAVAHKLATTNQQESWGIQTLLIPDCAISAGVVQQRGQPGTVVADLG